MFTYNNGFNVMCRFENLTIKKINKLFGTFKHGKNTTISTRIFIQLTSFNLEDLFKVLQLLRRNCREIWKVIISYGLNEDARRVNKDKFYEELQRPIDIGEENGENDNIDIEKYMG